MGPVRGTTRSLVWSPLADEACDGHRSTISWLSAGAPHGAGDMSSAPAVAFPVADLVDALGDDLADPWDVRKAVAIYWRLILAARAEWPSAALLAFIVDPTSSAQVFSNSLAEHCRPAELVGDRRAVLAAITEPLAPGLNSR